MTHVAIRFSESRCHGTEAPFVQLVVREGLNCGSTRGWMIIFRKLLLQLNSVYWWCLDLTNSGKMKIPTPVDKVMLAKTNTF